MMNYNMYGDTHTLMHKELKKKLNIKDTKVGRLNNRMSGDVTH